MIRLRSNQVECVEPDFYLLVLIFIFDDLAAGETTLIHGLAVPKAPTLDLAG